MDQLNEIIPANDVTAIHNVHIVAVNKSTSALVIELESPYEQLKREKDDMISQLNLAHAQEISNLCKIHI